MIRKQLMQLDLIINRYFIITIIVNFCLGRTILQMKETLNLRLILETL